MIRRREVLVLATAAVSLAGARANARPSASAYGQDDIALGRAQKLNRRGECSGSGLYPNVSECAGSESPFQANCATGKGQHMKSAFEFFSAD